MNERIEKLIEQATINIGDEFHPIDFFHKEKFAELIVRECIYYAFCHGDDIEYVKKHFGVK
jgi:hypothetical protein